ncbi:MAG TPA: T9SS type A sorting domain-containing protein [Flavobacteriales bacterium]|nr:T9SS type A sorting domain-containing protein [Flavobacteriales bacterium]
MKHILTILFIGFITLTSKSQCTYLIDTTNLLKVTADTSFTVSDTNKIIWVCEGIHTSVSIGVPCTFYFERGSSCNMYGSPDGVKIYAKYGTYIDTWPLVNWCDLTMQENGAMITYWGLTNVWCDTLTYDYSLVGPHVPCMTFDYDGDGVADSLDNCFDSMNAAQDDVDGDGLGDACDACNDLIDADGDMVGDACDNCPVLFNDQADTDADNIGNACDNCPTHSNMYQYDLDDDDVGDPCDNCIGNFNPDQADADGDGVGDACEGIGINEINGKRFQVAPNPVHDHFTIYGQQQFNNACIQLCDVSGKLVFENKILSGLNLHVDVSSLSNGMYYLVVIEGGNKAISKLLKN